MGPVGSATVQAQDGNELLVPLALWQPPPQCDASGAKPKGASQADAGPNGLLTPFIWGNVGRG